ncbi:MAG TPA: DUF2243 domain-containing protein, partial [Chloroflexota bacterium]|nr:DUF2243 domain-containing protein [Chloroflexota bacterium]
QILQWHHMLTDAGFPASSVEGLMVNTFWDGMFHATTYLFTIAGVILLWRGLHQAQERLPFQTLIGGILVGWGLFNLVEGIVNHHLLGIHHVRPGPNQLWWDLGFLIWGAVMLLVGWRLIRAAQPATGGKGFSTKIIDLSARRSRRQTGAG